jgi:hypothetical protein
MADSILEVSWEGSHRDPLVGDDEDRVVAEPLFAVWSLRDDSFTIAVGEKQLSFRAG